jgi:hypothetical protein
MFFVNINYKNLPDVELALNVLITHLVDSHVHSFVLIDDCGHE